MARSIWSKSLADKELIALERVGVFIFAGLVPNINLFKDTPLQLSEQGYIITNEKMETNLARHIRCGQCTS